MHTYRSQATHCGGTGLMPVFSLARRYIARPMSAFAGNLDVGLRIHIKNR
jgi:hypothetical protein